MNLVNYYYLEVYLIMHLCGFKNSLVVDDEDFIFTFYEF